MQSLTEKQKKKDISSTIIDNRQRNEEKEKTYQ